MDLSHFILKKLNKKSISYFFFDKKIENLFIKKNKFNLFLVFQYKQKEKPLLLLEI